MVWPDKYDRLAYPFPLIYKGEERFASFEEVDDRFSFDPASASGI